jgi:hypothetical protein
MLYHRCSSTQQSAHQDCHAGLTCMQRCRMHCAVPRVPLCFGCVAHHCIREICKKPSSVWHVCTVQTEHAQNLFEKMLPEVTAMKDQFEELLYQVTQSKAYWTLSHLCVVRQATCSHLDCLSTCTPPHNSMLAIQPKPSCATQCLFRSVITGTMSAAMQHPGSNSHHLICSPTAVVTTACCACFQTQPAMAPTCRC